MVNVTLLLWIASLLCQIHSRKIEIQVLNAPLQVVTPKRNRGVHIVDKSVIKRKKYRRKNHVCADSCMCIGGKLGEPPDVVACTNTTHVTFPWEINRNTTHMSINGGDLDKLTPNMFKGLTKLKRLSVTRCQLSSVMEWSFRNLSSLEYLNLARNNFSSVSLTGSRRGSTFPTGSLNNTKDLAQLDLSNNTISSILHERTFEPLRYLKILRLSGNLLAQVGREFSKLWGLRELDLRGNKLQAVHPSSLGMALKLKELDISGNLLRLVPKEVFTNLMELVKLDLSNNHLFAIEEGTLDNMTSLQEIYLQKNRLKWFDVFTFRYSKKLTIADLSNNAIEIIEDLSFESANALETLLLNKNELETINKRSFSGARKLQTLQLSDNHLTNIQEGALDELVKLQYLLLDNNALEWLSPYLFDSLLDVRTISLRNNKLVSLDSRWFLSPTLALESQFLLNDYKLKPIPATIGATAQYRHMETVVTDYDFSGNRWACGCEANVFLAWVHQQNAIHIRKLKTVQCYEPFFRRGRKMTDFKASEGFCRNQMLIYRFLFLFSVFISVTLWTFRGYLKKQKLVKPHCKNM